MLSPQSHATGLLGGLIVSSGPLFELKTLSKTAKTEGKLSRSAQQALLAQ